jgi:hypothetical protein
LKYFAADAVLGATIGSYLLFYLDYNLVFENGLQVLGTTGRHLILLIAAVIDVHDVVLGANQRHLVLIEFHEWMFWMMTVVFGWYLVLN